jgi:hypothetical protein
MCKLWNISGKPTKKYESTVKKDWPVCSSLFTTFKLILREAKAHRSTEVINQVGQVLEDGGDD